MVSASYFSALFGTKILGEGCAYVRLKSFPQELLSEIKIIDKTFLDSFNTDFKIIIDDIDRVLDKN